MNTNNKDNEQPKQKDPGLFKGVMAAYSVLILHALLIVVLGLIVIFFRGIIQYMIWIFLGGCALILASAWYSLHKLKKNHRQIIDVLSLPEFADRNIEIKLLGGLASLKMTKQAETESLALPLQQEVFLEDTSTQRLRTLADLGKHFEAGLMNREEYDAAKAEIMALREPPDLADQTIDILPADTIRQTILKDKE